MKRIIVSLIVLNLAFDSMANAQAFDSARVDPICFKATYSVGIDRMYIKSIADATLYADAKKADSLYNMFQNNKSEIHKGNARVEKLYKYKTKH